LRTPFGKLSKRAVLDQTAALSFARLVRFRKIETVPVLAVAVGEGRVEEEI
jgi:hypothetical protein